MAITFTKRADGAIIGDFSASRHTGDLDTLSVLAIPVVRENDVIRFAHDREASKGALTAVPLVLGDGSYAVANGVTEYTIVAVGLTEYTVRRGDT